MAATNCCRSQQKTDIETVIDIATETTIATIAETITATTDLDLITRSLTLQLFLSMTLSLYEQTVSILHLQSYLMFKYKNSGPKGRDICMPFKIAKAMEQLSKLWNTDDTNLLANYR